MAQKTIVSLIDDLSGETADETVRFGLDGAQYEIDLSEVNAKKLREALASFVSAGRRSGGRPAGGRRAPHAASPRSAAADRTADIREWARDNGYTVSDRGRIASNIVEAFDKAH
ncbi:Lsr2 protein [Parafrankia irregularis]|uniref:Lsr2 protein n=1 Tax=Parafrankia irregularis TaxID=795642 RepID=A0A0S4QNP0_9ACTN|nr:MULTISPECIES: Lsr2 family protein [Parafrankia]MBE3200280.1 Lsr2 family protein [Parafrankia sp. CH37]CUU56520.1 Lsr2 protein [Parafrankia irregularis]